MALTHSIVSQRFFINNSSPDRGGESLRGVGEV